MCNFAILQPIFLTSKTHVSTYKTTISCLKSSVSLFVYRPVKMLHNAPLTSQIQKASVLLLKYRPNSRGW